MIGCQALVTMAMMLRSAEVFQQVPVSLILDSLRYLHVFANKSLLSISSVIYIMQLFIWFIPIICESWQSK